MALHLSNDLEPTMTRTTAFPHVTFTASDLKRFEAVSSKLHAAGDAGAYEGVRLPKVGIVTVWADGDVTLMGAVLLRARPATETSVTDEQIEELRASYDSSGNLAMRAICTRALGERLTPGDREALREIEGLDITEEQARTQCASVILG